MVSPEFLFDFGSPNAYLAHKALPEIEARAGAAFDYVPCLLGGIFKATGNQSPIMANANSPSMNPVVGEDAINSVASVARIPPMASTPMPPIIHGVRRAPMSDP